MDLNDETAIIDLGRYSPYYQKTIQRTFFAPHPPKYLVNPGTPQPVIAQLLQLYYQAFVTLVPPNFPASPFSPTPIDVNGPAGAYGDSFKAIAKVLLVPYWPFPSGFESIITLPSPHVMTSQKWNTILEGARGAIFEHCFKPSPRFPNCCILPYYTPNHVALLYCFGQFTNGRATLTTVTWAEPDHEPQLSVYSATQICMYIEYAAKCSTVNVNHTALFKRHTGPVFGYEFLNISTSKLIRTSLGSQDQCSVICKLAFILFYRPNVAPTVNDYFVSHSLQIKGAQMFYDQLVRYHALKQTQNFSPSFHCQVSCYIEMLELRDQTGDIIMYNPGMTDYVYKFPELPQQRKRDIKEENKDSSDGIISPVYFKSGIEPQISPQLVQYIEDSGPDSPQDTALFLYQTIMDFENHHHNDFTQDIHTMITNIVNCLNDFIQQVNVTRASYTQAFLHLRSDLSFLFSYFGYTNVEFQASSPFVQSQMTLSKAVYPYRRPFSMDDLEEGRLHNVPISTAQAQAADRQYHQGDQDQVLMPLEEQILRTVKKPLLSSFAPSYNASDHPVSEIQDLDLHRSTHIAVATPARNPLEGPYFYFSGESLELRAIQLIVKNLINFYNQCQQIRLTNGHQGFYFLNVTSFRTAQGKPSVCPFNLILSSLVVFTQTFDQLVTSVAIEMANQMRSILEDYDEQDTIESFKISFRDLGWKWQIQKPGIGRSISSVALTSRINRQPNRAYSWFNNFSNLVHRFYTTYYLKWGPKFINSSCAVDLEYLEDSQYHLIHLVREQDKLKRHALIVNQPCLQVISNIILAFSMPAVRQHSPQPLFDLQHRGELYVQWIQESRLSLMDPSSLKGTAKSYMKGIIQETAESLKQLEAHPSIVQYVGDVSCNAFQSALNALYLGSQGIATRQSEQYQLLSRHCLNGKIFLVVKVLNQMLSQLYCRHNVFYMSIHTLVSCIQSHPNTLDRGFNDIATSKAILQKMQTDNYNLGSADAEDFCIITTTDHALLFKVKQLNLLAQHIFTQSFCKRHSQRSSYEQHCLVFKDPDNIDGQFYKINLQKADPNNTVVHLLSNQEIVDKHISDRKLKNNKFLSKHQNFNFYNQYIGDIKVDKFNQLADDQKASLLIYLTNKKLQYKFDADILEHYNEDQYYFQKIFGAIQIPFDLIFKDQVLMKDFIIRQRTMRFCNTGLLAFDCETFTYDDTSFGNQHVWCVSVYGRARSLKKSLHADLIEVDRIFTGISAMDDFADYLLYTGIILDIVDEQQCKNYIALQTSFGKVQPNTIYAHNGNKFDFKLLISSLQRICKVTTIGDVNSMKKLSTVGCDFMDSLMIIKDSLSKLTKTFKFPIQQRFTYEKCPSKQEQLVLRQYLSHDSTLKQEFDVKGYSFDKYKIHMEQRAHGRCEFLDKFEAYCRHDSVSLYFVVHIFFERNYTCFFERMSYDNVCHTLTFLPTMFPLSTASLSTEAFKLAYSNHVLRTNVSSLDIERSTFTGGFTSLFSTRMTLGLCGDVNSSYAAALCNPVPAFHDITFSNGRNMSYYIQGNAALTHELQQEYLDYQCVKLIACDIDVELGVDAIFIYDGQQFNIKPHCLYKILFKVKRGEEYGEQDCILSALIVRSLTGDSIVEPSEVSSDDHKIDDQEQILGGVWVWGVKILYMLKMNYLINLRIEQAIFYHEYPIFRGFIETQYKLRLKAKAMGDVLGSTYCKDLMNTVFGKMGQKPIGIVETGDPCDLVESIAFLKSSQDQRKVQAFSFKQYIAKQPLFIQSNSIIDVIERQEAGQFRSDIHQIRIEPSKQDALNQIGSLVRIASYVSTIGQLELVQAFNKLNVEFNIKRKGQGILKFCYTDTDSIYFDMWEPLLYEYRDSPNHELLLQFHAAWIILSDHFIDTRELAPCHQALCRKIKILFLESQCYKLLLELEIFNPREFGKFTPTIFQHDGMLRPFKLIDQNELGGYKLERMCFGGVFTAPKQYTILSLDMENASDTVVPVFKGKGVKKDSLAANHTAFIRQETGFVTVIEYFAPFFQTPQIQQQLIDARSSYKTGQQKLTSLLQQIKISFEKVCSDAFNQMATQDHLRKAAESMICIFVNEAAFQASGSFITIRDVAKTVMPSISKREAIVYDGNGVDSTPASDLFAFEIQRLKQSLILNQIRQHVINNVQTAKSILDNHKLSLSLEPTQQQRGANTFSKTLRAALKLSQLANKITNRIQIINEIVRSQNPTTLADINDKLLSNSLQHMRLEEVIELFDQLNTFSYARSKFAQLNSLGRDDLYSILLYVYFESQRYWYWPLTHQNIKNQLHSQDFTQAQIDIIIEDFIITAALANFTRVFKISCPQLNEFQRICNDLYQRNMDRTKAIFPQACFESLITQMDTIQSYSFEVRNPQTSRVRYVRVKDMAALSLLEFNNRKDSKPSPIAKAVINQFRAVTQKVEMRLHGGITQQMLNSIRIGVVSILNDAVKENFSFDRVKAMNTDLEPFMSLPADLLLEDILPITSQVVICTNSDLSKVKKNVLLPANQQTTYINTSDHKAALNHLQKLKSRLSSKFDEEQIHDYFETQERVAILNQVNLSDEVQIET